MKASRKRGEEDEEEKKMGQNNRKKMISPGIRGGEGLHTSRLSEEPSPQRTLAEKKKFNHLVSSVQASLREILER